VEVWKARCQSANNGVTIAFAVSVDKLTSRLNFTIEKVNNGFSVHVIVEVSLSVVDELNNHLISLKVKTNVADVGGLKVGRLEEHVKESKWKRSL
jgi:hypothetical protein